MSHVNQPPHYRDGTCCVSCRMSDSQQGNAMHTMCLKHGGMVFLGSLCDDYERWPPEKGEKT